MFRALVSGHAAAVGVRVFTDTDGTKYAAFPANDIVRPARAPAMHYTFTLKFDAKVTIDLSSSADTHVVVIRGRGVGGALMVRRCRL